MKKRNVKSYIRPIVCIAGVVLIFIIIGFIYMTSSHPVDSDMWKMSYDEDWTVYYKGQEYTNVDLTEFKLPETLDKGESITLTNRIPSDLSSSIYKNPTLRITSRNSTVLVSVNGKTRYTYGQERYANNQMIGSGRHNISLYPADDGKIISITFTSTEDKSFSSFERASIYNGNTMYQYELVKGKIPFTVSLLLIMLGFCIMIVTLLACIKDTKFLELFLVGCISVLIGTWSLCYYGFVQYFDIQIYQSAILEYLALYLFAVPLLIYFRTYVDATCSRFIKCVYHILFSLQLILDVVLITLQVTGIQHFPTSLPMMHVFIAIEVAYVVLLLIMNARKGDISSRAILAGTVAMVVFVFAEYAIFALKKYKGVQVSSLQGLAAVGTLIFVFTLITAFSMQIANRLRVSTEKNVLYRMAYTDELTKLYNRRFCEQKLNSLVTDHMDYGIINLDLNGLKGINDTQGHHVGDSLIAGFAAILRDTFSGVGTVGRMGGDEFIVIIEGLDGFNYRKYISSLTEHIQNANKTEERFGYSTSYGYADSREVKDKLTGTAQDSDLVYNLADSRMYEYKRNFKKEND